VLKQAALRLIPIPFHGALWVGIGITCNAGPRPRSKSLVLIVEDAMFVFFSSRLGCLGSIAVSLVLTLLLLLLLGVF
jgi:hypothetical protein